MTHIYLKKGAEPATETLSAPVFNKPQAVDSV